MSMEQFKVNLATFEYQDKRIAYPLLILLILLTLLFSGYNARLLFHYREQISGHREKIARLDQTAAAEKKVARQSPTRMKEERKQSIKTEIDLVNELIIRDAFPWDRLLTALEACIPRGIALSSFAPSEDLKKVKLKGNAISLDQVRELFAKLDESRVYTQNDLLNLSVAHETPPAGKPGPGGTVVTFEIESTLKTDDLLTGAAAPSR